MAKLWTVLGVCPLPLKFTFVSMLGFVTDAALLHLLMAMGAAPAWARIVSLFCAMQVTFLINGLLVFRCLDISRPWRQWGAYMLAHGFGNLCNYWIFVTLVSIRRPPFSVPLAALAVASVSAWVMNYLGARYFVFRRVKEISERVRPLSAGPRDGRGPVLR